MLPSKKYYANQFVTRDAKCNGMIAGGMMLGARVLIKDLNLLASSNPLRDICKDLEAVVVIAEPFIDTENAITMVVYHEPSKTERAVRAENWVLAL